MMSLRAGVSSGDLEDRSCEYFVNILYLYKLMVKSASIFIAECMLEFYMDNLRMEFVLCKASSGIQFEINMALSFPGEKLAITCHYLLFRKVSLLK